MIGLWLISAEHYGELRKLLPDCKSLHDLESTKTDNLSVLEIAVRMGIMEEHMWIDIDPTFEDLKKSFQEIYKLEHKLAAAGIPFTLFNYCGGHGGT